MRLSLLSLRISGLGFLWRVNNICSSVSAVRKLWLIIVVTQSVPNANEDVTIILTILLFKVTVFLISRSMNLSMKNVPFVFGLGLKVSWSLAFSLILENLRKNKNSSGFIIELCEPLLRILEFLCLFIKRRRFINDPLLLVPLCNYVIIRRKNYLDLRKSELLTYLSFDEIFEKCYLNKQFTSTSGNL